MTKKTISQIHTEGYNLLGEAVKMMKAGKVQEAENLRNKATKILDEAVIAAQQDAERVNALYGEKCNFGIIYNVLENNLTNLMSSKSGRKVISEAVKMIQSDDALKGQFNVYQSVEQPTNTTNPDLYLEEALKLMPPVSPEQIEKSNRCLLEAVRKSGVVDELVDIDDKILECYDAVECLLTTPQTPANLDKIVEARTTIVNYISNNPIPAGSKAMEELNKLTNEMASREDCPNADEIKLYQSIASSENPRAMYEEYRQGLLESIKDEMSHSTDSGIQWEELHDRIMNERFNRMDPYSSIAQLVEIKSIIDSPKM